jgi:hypothetical protein
MQALSRHTNPLQHTPATSKPAKYQVCANGLQGWAAPAQARREEISSCTSTGQQECGGNVLESNNTSRVTCGTVPSARNDTQRSSCSCS